MNPSRIALLLVSLTFSLLGEAVHAQSPAPTPTEANVKYGVHERQVLDFYKAATPDGKPTGLMFFVHGGGWMNGDKANPDFLAACLKDGISVISINYRLIPDARLENIYPPVKACLDDAKRALQFVRSKSAEWNIDKDRIGGCGGSAGGFTVLWLGFHPDMAEPNSADPIARESTRLKCIFTFVPQTSLDPVQIRQWLPDCDYGHHAFSLPSFQEFINKREELMPWITQFSPYELVSSDDPPVYLFYDSVPAMGQPSKDPVHNANFGLGLEAKLKEQNVPYEFHYQGAPNVKYPGLFGFLVEHLKNPGK